MTVTFLAPSASFVGLLGLLVFVAVLVSQRREKRFCRRFGIAPRPLRARIGTLLFVAAITGLVAFAAALPVARSTEAYVFRTDAEMLFVFDESESMQARKARDAPMRFERAVALADALRDVVPGVPVGIASLTNRILPHLFPTVDDEAFRSAMAYSVGVNQPPPGEKPFGFSTSRITNFGALTNVVGRGYFSDEEPPVTQDAAGSGTDGEQTTPKRAVVVFTDGESNSVNASFLANVFTENGVVLVFVQFWDSNERVYIDGAVSGYAPDPESRELLTLLAAYEGIEVFSEDRLDELAQTLRTFFGKGEGEVVGERETTQHLAPYAFGLAVLFAAFVAVLRSSFRFRRKAAWRPRRPTRRPH